MIMLASGQRLWLTSRAARRPHGTNALTLSAAQTAIAIISLPMEWHRIMTLVLLTALTRSGCEVALFNEPPPG